jgi:hypothetical protein
MSRRCTSSPPSASVACSGQLYFFYFLEEFKNIGIKLEEASTKSCRDEGDKG